MHFQEKKNCWMIVEFDLHFKFQNIVKICILLKPKVIEDVWLIWLRTYMGLQLWLTLSDAGYWDMWLTEGFNIMSTCPNGRSNISIFGTQVFENWRYNAIYTHFYYKKSLYRCSENCSGFCHFLGRIIKIGMDRLHSIHLPYSAWRLGQLIQQWEAGGYLPPTQGEFHFHA